MLIILSIKLINENVLKVYFSFKEVSLNVIEKEVTALDSKKAYMSSSTLSGKIFVGDNFRRG